MTTRTVFNLLGITASLAGMKLLPPMPYWRAFVIALLFATVGVCAAFADKR